MPNADYTDIRDKLIPYYKNLNAPKNPPPLKTSKKASKSSSPDPVATHNNLDGHGTETYPDGGFYEGEFKNGRRHGKGRFSFVSGDIYEGDFRNDQLDGTGIYTNTDGGVYEGGFKDSKKHGHGRYVN